MFCFDPTLTTMKTVLAFTYSPKILNNYITSRTKTGFLYILSGEYVYSYGNSDFSGKSDSLIYLPPGSVPYSYRICDYDGKPLRTMQIEVELTDVQSGAPLALSEHPLLLTGHADVSVRECFEAIIALHNKKDPEARLMEHSELYKLLFYCIKYTSKEPSSAADSSIAPALRFIQENYRKNFCVSELAALCHISESQLRRRFINAIGKSPISYKNELILRDACRFLDTSELSVGEISEMLGFCDIYAFSHFLKKHTGMSPKTYRANNVEI